LEDPPADDAANGKRLFVALGCFECHGHVGQGGAYTSPTRVLAKTALLAEAFVAFIAEPPMPPRCCPTRPLPTSMPICSRGRRRGYSTIEAAILHLKVRRSRRQNSSADDRLERAQAVGADPGFIFVKRFLADCNKDVAAKLLGLGRRVGSDFIQVLQGPPEIHQRIAIAE
jgi:hypothetical protein